MSRGEALAGLAGNADHDAAADLVAQRAGGRGCAKRSERRPGRRRVDARRRAPGRGLEAQQVAVGAGLAPRGEVLVGPLAEAERDRQPVVRLDAAHDVGHASRGSGRSPRPPGARRCRSRVAAASPAQARISSARHPVAGRARRSRRDAAVARSCRTQWLEISMSPRRWTSSPTRSRRTASALRSRAAERRLGSVSRSQARISGAIDHVVTSTGAASRGIRGRPPGRRGRAPAPARGCPSEQAIVSP